MAIDTSNELFRLADELVNYTSRNIFLTGKAGTGKTTFLKHIQETCPKQMAIVAPTGVAAINAGGTTIHSFFQLPITPFLPEGKQGWGEGETNNKHSLLARLRMNTDKRKVMEALELLVIDEISMVRCDVLDAIDVVLKHFKNNHSDAFGGVQLLFIGDLYQLPPVANPPEWSILGQFYRTPFFFSSHVIEQAPPLYISFEKIYRQKDQQFIDILNGIRNNDIPDKQLDLLNSLCETIDSSHEDHIILTTHNNKADKINADQLAKLQSKARSFKAQIEGEFYEKSYPAEETLSLKEGARVMFIKNDTDKTKRYFNGKIGIVTRIEERSIFVQCKGEKEAIEVPLEKWDNIRYALNKETRQIEEDVIGSFSQYPLRLAWAITIHKSQGLTFERAVIDAEAAFSPGQVYVALSRCTSIAGLVLSSRINRNSLKTDERIHQFIKGEVSANDIQAELRKGKGAHQKALLVGLFNVKGLVSRAQELQQHVESNSGSFNEISIQWTKDLLTALTETEEVARKFLTQLQQLFSQAEVPEEHETLQARVKAASRYFHDQLQKQLQLINASPAATDNRLLAKQYNVLLSDLFTALGEKCYLLEYCSHGFNATGWYEKKNQFKRGSFTANAYAASSANKAEHTEHPLLHQQLRKLRDDICSKTGRPVYMVASSRTIDEVCKYLPQNLHELGNISGFGKAKLKEFGSQFVDAVNAYCTSRELSSQMHTKEVKRVKKERIDTEPVVKKPNSLEETLNLFNEGKTIHEIAAVRNLARSTIEGHMAQLVRKGLVDIFKIMTADRIALIEAVIQNNEGEAPGTIKAQLPPDVSYPEVNMVIAWKSNTKMAE